jgi:outer membrane protein TolC
MIKKGIKSSLIMAFVCVITACSVKSVPLSIDDRYAEAQADVKELFTPQKDLPLNIDYYDALARSLKYNLDYRIKLVNYALQAGQLKVAEFTMFPALNVSGSLYTRDNDLSSFGTTLTGHPTDVLNSTPRTLRSARTALSWNILDFGLGYVRAKQQSERILIAQEEAHKQEQTLAQDVLRAYWDAYNAQQLIHETRDFQALLSKAKVKIYAAMRDKLIPQENILDYQSALLEGNRRLVQLEYKYDKAMLDLRHLMNVPPDIKLVLAAPPYALRHTQDLSHINFQKLDAITLVNRPELKGQDYQRRIAELGVKTVLLQALPGITFNDGWNYNSNKFLINNKWMDRSMDVAWNLLNLASLPTTYQAAQLEVKYEKLKRMALTVAVLTETRYAYWHYTTLRDEYVIVHKQVINSEALYKLNRNRQLASLASDQQVILAKLRVITTKMDEQLLLSDLSTALGELYLSIGADILPIDVEDQSIPVLTAKIRETFTLDKTLDINTYINRTYADYFTPKIMAPQTKFIVQKTAPNQTKMIVENRKQEPQIHASNRSEQIIKPHITLTNDAIIHITNRALAKAMHTPKTSYTIQLLGSYHIDDVKNLQAHLAEHIQNSQIGKTQHNGRDWYVLTLGQFHKVTEAKNQIKQLSENVQLSKIWIRDTRTIQYV